MEHSPVFSVDDSGFVMRVNTPDARKESNYEF